MAIDVRESPRNSIRVSNHDDATDSCRTLVVEFVESFLHDRCALRISEQEILLVWAVLEAVLDNINSALHSGSNILIEAGGIHDGLAHSTGIIGQDTFEDNLEH